MYACTCTYRRKEDDQKISMKLSGECTQCFLVHCAKASQLPSYSSFFPFPPPTHTVPQTKVVANSVSQDRGPGDSDISSDLSTAGREGLDIATKERRGGEMRVKREGQEGMEEEEKEGEEVEREYEEDDFSKLSNVVQYGG